MLVTHKALCHIFGDGNDGFHTVAQDCYSLCIEHMAQAIFTETFQFRIVSPQKDIAVTKAYVMESFAVIHTGLHVLQRQVGITPGKQYHRIDKESQQEIEQYAGNHNHQPLPGWFGAELVRLGRLCHRLFVHALVYHTGYLAITSQGKPADAVFRFTVFRLELEYRKPGVEKEVELLYPDLKDTGKDKMPELVDQDQYR